MPCSALDGSGWRMPPLLAINGCWPLFQRNGRARRQHPGVAPGGSANCCLATGSAARDPLERHPST
eukprot:5920932-Prorocentrum_lima.AAC.1